jgi:hypothetical protein
VEDKSLQVAQWAWDSTDVPPLGAFLYVLHLAHGLWHRNAKQQLPREQVPTTPPFGYALQLGAQQMQLVCSTGLRQAAARSQPPRTAQHSTAQPSATIQVRSADEDCSDTSSLLLPHYSTSSSLLSSSSNSSYDRSSGGGAGAFDAAVWAEQARTRVFSSAAEAVEALPWLPSDAVSSACLSSSSNRRVFTVGVPVVRAQGMAARHTIAAPQQKLPITALLCRRQCGPASDASGTRWGASDPFARWQTFSSPCSACLTLQGHIGETPAALKVFSIKDAASLSAFVAEATTYVQLQEQQSVCVPKLLALGRMPHSGVPVLALSLGEPMTMQLLQQHATAAKECLQGLHAAGWAHGDVRPSNFVRVGGTVVLCDLESCSAATEAARKQDTELLHTHLSSSS